MPHRATLSSPRARARAALRVAATGVLAVLVACEPGAARTVVVPAETLATIRERPYVAGNGPGGFATARLAGLAPAADAPGIRFTGFGPYLYEFGFRPDMRIIAIDGADPREVLKARWAALRLRDPAAFDADHYRDLIRYLFVERDAGSFTLTVEIPRSVELATNGAYQEGVETWRFELAR